MSNYQSTDEFLALDPAENIWPIIVNFVISKDSGSGIFRSIHSRFQRYAPKRLIVEISVEPIADADVYHYHRPHLVETLATPAVATVHHDPTDVDPWLDPRPFWGAYRQCSAVVCLNTRQHSALAQRDIHHASVIPHGFDQNLFSKQLKQFDPEKKINLGLVSRRYGRRVKGETYLEELASGLSTELFRFTLVGSGRSVDAELLRAMGFEVDVFEFLPYRMFGNLYRDLDFLLMVSFAEGGPANIPEALASSTPVVCTNVGMVPDIVRDGENGVIISGDANVDLDTFVAIAENRNGMTTRLFEGAHALDTIIPWEDVISQHIDLYREIILGSKEMGQETQPSD